MTDKNEKLLQFFRDMTLLELSQFVKEFEREFDVKAMAPTESMHDTPPAPDAPAEEEQDEFDVYLESAGGQKIQVIKVVRSLTSLGLKEAKDLVDSAPAKLMTGVPKDKAADVVGKLVAAGATASAK